MAKVTSKLQVTIPKALAEKFGFAPGDEIVWSALADAIRLTRQSDAPRGDAGARLSLFDAATERQRCRERETSLQAKDEDRGWSREELYERGQPS